MGSVQLTLGMFDFWKHTNYNQNIKLIPACFAFIFDEIKSPKSDLFNYWNSLKDENDNTEKMARTNYSKSINDWIEKGATPSWKIIKTIFASPCPENIEFKESESNYYLFKTNLFLGYFFSNFFRSLEEQNLVSPKFKDIVQDGLRCFYRYVFVVKDFRKYQWHEVQNPMFSLMRFLVLPTNKSKNLISKYIVEAFDKEIGLTPAEMYECHSLYYIPLETICFPVIEKKELEKELKAYQIIYETFMELSTWKGYGMYENKIITEKEMDFIFSQFDSVLDKCKNFFYNWFKGKYHVLCHEFETGLDFYRKAFEHRYFGGKYLSQYLSEFVALMQKINVKKTEFNHIHEWANAIRLYIDKIDNVKENKISIQNSFDEVFPEEAFIK